MKKLVTAVKPNSRGNGDMGLVDVVDGQHKMIVSMGSCRAYIGEHVGKVKFSGRAISTYYGEANLFNYKNSKTLIAIAVDEAHIKSFTNNLRWLHEKESKAKVSKTVVYQTQHKDLYIVEGSKYWKDSAWKIMLYTFYLRLMSRSVDPEEGKDSGAAGYWPALRIVNKETDETKEQILLSKLKNQKEFFHKDYFSKSEWGFSGFHNREGFFSICSGSNPPMAKLLGVDF